MSVSKLQESLQHDSVIEIINSKEETIMGMPTMSPLVQLACLNKAKKPIVKREAQRNILFYIMEFSLSRVFGCEKRTHGGLYDFSFQYEDENHRAEPGDLVVLTSGKPGTCNLGWLISRERPNPGWFEYFTIENVNDGEIATWPNVGLMYFNREQRRRHPEWRWTDRQYAFNKKWMRCCFKERDAYMYLPVQSSFEVDSFAVTLTMRTRFGLGDVYPSVTFPDWRKVTKAMMLKFYDAGCKKMKQGEIGVRGSLKSHERMDIRSGERCREETTSLS